MIIKCDIIECVNNKDGKCIRKNILIEDWGDRGIMPVCVDFERKERKIKNEDMR